LSGIFINYRRDDAAGMAGRLFDHLAKAFSRQKVFMDVDAMKPGLDFVKQLDAQVSQCNVLLAVIGPHWSSARDEKSNRRLDSDRDYVRIELASALKRDIPVIPVLVDGAEMPVEEDLPDDLKALVRRHGVEVRHSHFSADANALVHALRDILPRQRSKLLLSLSAAAILAAVIAGAVYFWPKGPAVVAGNTNPPTATAVSPQPGTANAPGATDIAGKIAEVKRKAEEARQKAEEARQKAEEARQKAEEARQRVAARPSQQPTTPTQQSSAPANDPRTSLQLDGLSVKLRDTLDRVRQAYPDAASMNSDPSKPADLKLSMNGIRLFFSDQQVLRNIRLDSPFKGSIQGLHIGDSVDDVTRQLGQPYTTPWDFLDNKAYAYRISDAVVRYDVNQSGKIVTIFVIMSR